MKKLLFVVNVDWFFVSHRLPIARSALANGYEVHIVCSFTDKYSYLKREGFFLHDIPLSRGGMSIINEIKLVSRIFYVINIVKPDILHLVTIKPVIYGSIIGRILAVNKTVAAISGLGYVFIGHDLKTRVIRRIVLSLYRYGLRRDTVKVVFQNLDDEALFLDNRVIYPKSAVIIKGSGVDLNEFDVVREPDGDPIVMFVGRILSDKGVVEFVEAANLLEVKKVVVRMVIVGGIDKENPNAVLEEELHSWTDKGMIEWWGFREDMALTMSQANVIVLPSYREGLPKSLIEAGACGRAIITTNVPGCRDAIIPGETGLLVEPRNVDALAAAIEILVLDKQRRFELGLRGRELAEKEFDVKSVVEKHLQIYAG